MNIAFDTYFNDGLMLDFFVNNEKQEKAWEKAFH